MFVCLFCLFLFACKYQTCELFLFFSLFFHVFCSFFLFFLLIFHVMSCHHLFFFFKKSFMQVYFILKNIFLKKNFIFLSFFFFKIWHVASCHVMSWQGKKLKFQKRLGQFFFYTSNRACMQNFMLLWKIPTDSYMPPLDHRKSKGLQKISLI